MEPRPGAPQVRPATEADHAGLLAIARPIVRAGETWALDRDLDDEALLAYWWTPNKTVFVAELDGVVAGIAFLQRNAGGGGAHVANAGFMTAEEFRGRGVARALCAHVLDEAAARGFRAMQFNYVVSSNERAVRLWESFGFRTLTRVPGAFRHPSLGFVDVLVLWKDLVSPV
jgi:GNAT superfamily N-acetyltransferase